MPKRKGPEPCRLNLALRPQVMKQLEAICEQGGMISKTEAIRKAINLYSLAIESQAGGGTLFIRDSDGTEFRLRLI